jgi:hypothetical protein
LVFAFLAFTLVFATSGLTSSAFAEVAPVITVTFDSGPYVAGVTTNATVTVFDGTTPVEGSLVSLAGDNGSGSVALGIPTSTDASGSVTIPVTFPVRGSFQVKAQAPVAQLSYLSAPVAVNVDPAATSLTLGASPLSVVSGSASTFTSVFKVNGTPRAGVTVSFKNGSTVLATDVTDASGSASASVALSTLPSVSVTASVEGTDEFDAVSSASVVVTVTAKPKSSVKVSVSVPSKVISEKAFNVSVSVRALGSNDPVAGSTVSVFVKAYKASSYKLVAHGSANSSGLVTLKATLWKTGNLYATASASASSLAGQSSGVKVTVVAGFSKVAFPKGAPQPRVMYPDAPAPVGTGANAVVSRIPDDVWRSMQGLTWHSGCVSRSGLRYVTVNYIGFDGFRYRGAIVVRSDAASATAGVFTNLYNIKYPIRMMVPEDRFGHNPKGPGANDYASMAADNTSGFNCRYVVGSEPEHIMSPHASGRAIDINTWENPYVSHRGTYPNSWWLSRSRSGPEVMRPGSAAVHAFTSRGFGWLYPFDTQHFQR